MKIVVFILFFVVLNNLSFGKTLNFTTYFGYISIDDVNGQVVFDYKSIYNITAAENNSGRIYLENEYGEKLMLEYMKDSQFESFNIYKFNGRYELYGNFKIMSFSESNKEPIISSRSGDFIPLRDIILKEYYGGNKKLFMSDAWYLKDIDERVKIVCSIYLRVLRTKSFNISNEICYSNYNDMEKKGDLDKLIQLLVDGKLNDSKMFLNRLYLDFRLLYYYDRTKNKWLNYFGYEGI